MLSDPIMTRDMVTTLCSAQSVNRTEGEGDVELHTEPLSAHSWTTTLLSHTHTH